MKFSYCACTSLRELSAIPKHELFALLIVDVYATRKHEVSLAWNIKFAQPKYEVYALSRIRDGANIKFTMPKYEVYAVF